MSKIKDQVLRDEELKMEYMFSYMEWLDKYMPSLNDTEIIKMENQVNQFPQTKRIISEQPLNNINYNSKTGASKWKN